MFEVLERTQILSTRQLLLSQLSLLSSMSLSSQATLATTETMSNMTVEDRMVPTRMARSGTTRANETAPRSTMLLGISDMMSLEAAQAGETAPPSTLKSMKSTNRDVKLQCPD